MTTKLPLVYVSIFCTHCGNRTMVDANTGERITLQIKVVLRDYPQLCEDVAAMRCTDCGGPMDLKVLDASSEL
jgi:DNA-directed RNA polymerase subunit RPC12/RpoP